MVIKPTGERILCVSAFFWIVLILIESATNYWIPLDIPLVNQDRKERMNWRTLSDKEEISFFNAHV